MSQVQYETGWRYDEDHGTWRAPGLGGTLPHEHRLRDLYGAGAFPVGDYTFPGNVTVADGKTLQASWLELRSPGGDPGIDFTRTPGSADYNVRLINNGSDTLHMLGVSGGRWGVLKVGSTPNASLGAYGWDSEWAHFGCWEDFLGVGDYGFMSHKNGDKIINSRASKDIIIRVNATDKVLIGTSGQRNYDWIRCMNSGVGIFFDPGGGGFYQNSGDGWIYVYGNKPIYTNNEIRAGDASMKTWAGGADHAVFQHRNRAGVGGEGYGFLQRWDGYVWVSSTGTINFNCSNGVNVMALDGVSLRVMIKGTDRFGGGDCFRFYSDGESWHWSIGIGGDNSENQGLYLNGDAVGRARFHRHDHIGNWDANPIWTSSGGGGSGSRMTYRAAGQNAAPQIKSWGAHFEVRSWDDAGFVIMRCVLENYSSKKGKKNIKDAKQKLPRADRKQKIKNLRTVHFNREMSPGCPSCFGSGRAKDNYDIKLKLNRKRLKLERNQELDPEDDIEEPNETQVCPACNGQGMGWRQETDKKNEEEGWFGFLTEEVAPEFPEAVFYRENENGEIEPNGLDSLALIAILWEEVKDLEERLTLAETKGK